VKTLAVGEGILNQDESCTYVKSILARLKNDFAWGLATAPLAESRHAKKAVECRGARVSMGCDVVLPILGSDVEDACIELHFHESGELSGKICPCSADFRHASRANNRVCCLRVNTRLTSIAFILALFYFVSAGEGVLGFTSQ
jgi:hypothetical protein